MTNKLKESVQEAITILNNRTGKLGEYDFTDYIKNSHEALKVLLHSINDHLDEVEEKELEVNSQLEKLNKLTIIDDSSIVVLDGIGNTVLNIGHSKDVLNVENGFELVELLHKITDISYEDSMKVIGSLSKYKDKEEIDEFISDINNIQNDTPVILKRAGM